jgi:hypothetical protein
MSAGHAFFLTFNNFALANRNLPDIIWCFARQTGGRSSSIDVSVLAVRYRALVFAAPQCFVADTRPAEMPGSRFRWARHRERTVAPSHKFLRPFEGVSCNPVLTSRKDSGRRDSQNRFAGQTDKRRKNNSATIRKEFL